MQTKAQLAPLMSSAGTNYRTIYREVCNFHERHNTQPKDWDVISEDMEALSRKLDHPFATALLLSVFEELEREG